MKTLRPSVIGMAIAVLMVLSCNKWTLEKTDFLQLEITSFQIYDADSIQVGFQLSDHFEKRVDNYGLTWSTDKNSPIFPLHAYKSFGGKNPGKDTSFTVTRYGFSSKYRYALAAYAKIEDEVFYSDTVLFSMPPPGVVQLLELNYGGGNSLELQGQYQNSTGTLQNAGFCWSTSKENPTLIDNFIDLGDLDGQDTFSYKLENLIQGATYHCRAFAIVKEAGAAADTVALFGNVIHFSADLEDVFIPMETFPGLPRAYATAFTLNGKGYIGGGIAATDPLLNDFWAYDPASGWDSVDDFFLSDDNAEGVAGTASFTIGDKAYLATGIMRDSTAPFITDDKLYSFHPDEGWKFKYIILNAGSIQPYPRSYGVGFSIGEEGFFGLGIGGHAYGGSFIKGKSTNDFWKYDPIGDTWNSTMPTGTLTPFPGTGRIKAVAFTVNGKAYVGTGKKEETNAYFNDFYAYDPVLDEWNPIAPLPGPPRAEAVAFSIGSKGYVAFGQLADGSITNELFEYDPAEDSWKMLPDFPGPARKGAVAFSLDGKAYISTGLGSSGLLNDFWEFHPH